MKTNPRKVLAGRIALATLGLLLGAGPSPAQDRPPTERAELTDGRTVTGRLVTEPGGEFVFRPDGSGEPIALEDVRAIQFEATGPDPALGTPPFRVLLGRERRISGDLVGVDEESVRLSVGGSPVEIARAGVRAVVQRPGATQIVREGFEDLDRSRWTGLVGDPQIVAEPKLVGARSLRLPAGGSALTARLEERLGSGSLSVAFLDDGRRAEGQRWFVDLTFRGERGEATIRAVLGWQGETLAVESPNGPRMRVQRLILPPGWHRLVVRFGPEETDLTVDGFELAHGGGLGLPLAEVRLATETIGDAPVPRGLAAHLDDLELARVSEPFGSLETEPSMDEVRLVSGDQLFGAIRSAEAERVVTLVDDREVVLPWSAVSGLYLRRRPATSAPVSGRLARVEWASAPGDGTRDRERDRVEGALVALDETGLTLDVPYLGRLSVPRDRLLRLEPGERTSRVVIDDASYHLGNRFITELDPPRPEPEPLEIAFELDEPPDGRAVLALDVVQAIGVTGSRDFSDKVKAGQLRTRIVLNDRPLDDLNTFIHSPNERPERVRVPIPAGALRAGRNVLRFEQTGEEDNPSARDNLGLLGVALEVPLDSPRGAPQP